MNFLQSIFGRLRTWITEAWTRTERRDRLRFFIIAGVALTLLIAAFTMLSAARYGTLAEAPSAALLASVTTILDENSIRYKVENDSTILVENNNLARAAGLIAPVENVGPELDYSVYKSAMSLTATESDRDFFRNAEKETEVRMALEGMVGVRYAQVTINAPDNDRYVFEKDYKQSTVGVVLTLEDGVTLTQGQVNGVEALVSGTTGVARENVTLVDQMMNPLNLKNDDDPSIALASQLAYQQSVERSIEDKINRLLYPYVGNHCAVMVTATIDFDERTSQSWSYSPEDDEGGIIRSIEQLSESALGRYVASGEPGLDEDGAGDEYSYVENGDLSEYKRDGSTTNYEIDEINESVKHAKGDITNLSIAVQFDTNYITDFTIDDEGNAVSTGTLSQASLDSLHDLIRTAAGLSAAESARVIVQGRPMIGAEESIANQKAYEAALARERFYEFIQTIVLYVIIAVCIILLVWRTLALFKPKTIELEPEGDDYLVGDLDEYGTLVEAAVSNMELELTKSSSRERVEEFIDSHPDAVAGMLRSWLSDESDDMW